MASFVPKWKIPKAAGLYPTWVTPVTRLPQTGAWSVTLQEAAAPRITGRKVPDLHYKKSISFLFLSSQFSPRNPPSSAGAWRKSNSLRPTQIPPGPHTQVFHAFDFFLLCTALHNPLTFAFLRSVSPSPISFTLDTDPVLQFIFWGASKSMWWNWWKTWEAAEPQRTRARVLLRKFFQFRRDLHTLHAALPPPPLRGLLSLLIKEHYKGRDSIKSYI